MNGLSIVKRRVGGRIDGARFGFRLLGCCAFLAALTACGDTAGTRSADGSNTPQSSASTASADTPTASETPEDARSGNGELRITFDDLGLPIACNLDDALVLGREYADRGVIFQGPSEGRGGTIVSPVCGGSDNEVPIPSGSHLLIFNYASHKAIGPEVMALDELYGSVSMLIRSNPYTQLKLSAYRDGDPLTQTTLKPGTYLWTGLVLPEVPGGFDRVVLELIDLEDAKPEGAFIHPLLYVDDLTFWPAEAVVPTPTLTFEEFDPSQRGSGS